MQQAASAQPLPSFSGYSGFHLIMAEAGCNSTFLPWIKLLLIWRSKTDTFLFKNSFPLHVKRQKKKKRRKNTPLASYSCKVALPLLSYRPFLICINSSCFTELLYVVSIKQCKFNTAFKSKCIKKCVFTDYNIYLISTAYVKWDLEIIRVINIPVILNKSQTKKCCWYL